MLPLTRNYRSRPEVLAAVNFLFGPEFGDEFQPLAASGEFPDPVFGSPVELLVTDKQSYAGTGVHWRRAEARHIARRVGELVDSGAASPGEIVLLFAAGTDAEWYEEELRAAGLPTYRATGRGYFGQQQVVDLLAYLRLLHNRYDDEALVTVLASPFVGVSNDTLVLLRRHTGRRPLFVGLERGPVTGIGADDERLLRAFRQRYERLSAASARLSLERLCEQVISEHDYDLAVLAQWDGRRRYANLRKLARLARSYEELRGPDVEGFVRFVREQEAVGAKELEAVAEEEGADAVRLLTIHAAKGLEFKVVVVADASRERAAPAPDEIIALSDGRFGFRMVDPVSSGRHSVFDYEEVRVAREAEERAERLRLYYVAMTRAIDRLIVSGAADLEQPGETTPIGWVLGRIDAAEELAASGRGAGRARARATRGCSCASTATGPRPKPSPRSSSRRTASSRCSPRCPRRRSRRLCLFRRSRRSRPRRSTRCAASRTARSRSSSAARSATTPSASRGCSPRTRASRFPVSRGSPRPRSATPSTGCSSWSTSTRPPPPDFEQVRSWYPAVTDEELARIAGFVEAYCASPLAARIAALDGAAPERPFAFEHDGVLLRGRLDVLHRDGPRALVLDYKTNVLGDASPAELIERDYRLQRLVYALVCFRAGAEEVEVVYAFLERPDAVVSTTFTLADLPALEAGLSEAIAAIQAGDFRPTPSEFTCAGCPARDVVCAGPRLLDD